MSEAVRKNSDEFSTRLNSATVQEGILDDVVHIIVHYLPDCRAIYRFGSWGSGTERHDSDLDLAILPAQRLQSLQRWELAQTLAVNVRRDIDLVDLFSVSSVLRMQVIAHGERLYCTDVREVERFEDVVFSMYARLNEERHEIVADAIQRGSIYGQ